MRMGTKSVIALASAGLLLAAGGRVAAHHAFGGEFDSNRPVLIKGKISKLELVNPHAWIHIEAREVTLAGEKKDLSGGTEVWAVEGGTPNTLLRRGLTRDSLPIGTEVVVDGYRAKNGTNRANGRDVMFPDGRKLFMGSSGVGAPPDAPAGK